MLQSPLLRMHILDACPHCVDTLLTIISDECNLSNLIAKATQVNRRQLFLDLTQAAISCIHFALETLNRCPQLVDSLAAAHTNTLGPRKRSASDCTGSMHNFAGQRYGSLHSGLGDGRPRRISCAYDERRPKNAP